MRSCFLNPSRDCHRRCLAFTGSATEGAEAGDCLLLRAAVTLTQCAQEISTNVATLAKQQARSAAAAQRSQVPTHPGLLPTKV